MPLSKRSGKARGIKNRRDAHVSLSASAKVGAMPLKGSEQAFNGNINFL